MSRKRLKCRVAKEKDPRKVLKIVCPECDFALDVSTAYDLFDIHIPGPTCRFKNNPENCPVRIAYFDPLMV